MSALDGLAPGDVLAVSDAAWWRPFPALIRLGSWLRGHYTWVDHVAVFHHWDAANVPWGIEGRPSGVGWVDLRAYGNRWMRTNRQETKTDAQRVEICARMEKLLGVGYDWEAIVADAEVDLAPLRPWFFGEHTPDPPGSVPQHVVCSSAAAWAYAGLDLEYPALFYRLCQPYDWYELFVEYGWR